MAAEEDDCWDAFGSDDEEEGEDAKLDISEGALTIALHLSQGFLRQNAQVRLSDRNVGLLQDINDSATRAALEQRGFQVIDDFDSTIPHLDALVITVEGTEETGVLNFLEHLLPGGALVSRDTLCVCNKDFLEQEEIYNSGAVCFVGNIKRAVNAHASICPWLPPSHSLKTEEERLQQATVTLSSYEISKSQMTEVSIERAVDCMNQFGYCVVRNVLDPSTSQTWGNTVLESVHSAAKILMERDQVDIYHPQASKSEPQSYRELSMREDLRLDLRHGPELSKLRSKGKNGNEPVVISAKTKEFDGFLRGHGSLLEIVRRTMNPKNGYLYKGNLGRYNFEGSGADGSYQDLRVSPVGGIVSFPGCADQAIHADTPHLFEHIPDLPAHYINIFTPGVPFDESVILATT